VAVVLHPDMTVQELQAVAVERTKAEPHLQVQLQVVAEVQPLPGVPRLLVVQLMVRNTQAVTVVVVALEQKQVVAAVVATTAVAVVIQTVLQMVAVVVARVTSTQPVDH
jgi:hypothetical protein